MIYSYSRLDAFEQCPYQWYLNYIEGAEPEDNWYAVNGSQVHAILERVANGELAIDDAGQEYIDGIGENYCDLKESIKEGVIDKCISFFAEYDFDYLADYEVVGAEIPLSFTVGGKDFRGFIDLALRDKTDGKIIIVDYKSSAWPFKKNGDVLKNEREKFEKYQRQEYLYCEGFKQMFPEYGYPKELSWLFFKEQKWARIPFDSVKHEESIAWALDVIDRIEREEEYLPNLGNYMNCNVLCGFRHTCEYKLAEEEDE